MLTPDVMSLSDVTSPAQRQVSYSRGEPITPVTINSSSGLQSEQDGEDGKGDQEIFSSTAWTMFMTSHEELNSQKPLDSALGFLQRLEESGRDHSSDDNTRHIPSFQLDFLQRSGQINQQSSTFSAGKEFCILSDKTASEYARVKVTQNLIRIYHDSMENALSCWLTERNCPYSNEIDAFGRLEWGPDWSNRICARVCRLDHATAAARRRNLSVTEDKSAARALHLSIMAFALQWAQHFDTPRDHIKTATTAHHERSMRSEVWNQARTALQNSSGIKSFRIAFANIIFSLTQRPLDSNQVADVDEILENDDSAVFLENALRQLFSHRYKLQQLKLRNHRPPLAGILQNQDTKNYGNTISDNPEIDAILANPENRDTFDLLFWLAVMFDTQTAAMHHRPPVVSDEDSEVSFDSQKALMNASQNPMDLDGWNMPSETMQRIRHKDLWGDFILHKSPERYASYKEPTRWPCSYEEAAAILSDGAPVKVLLYRRVTQLQTLIYRGAFPDRLEEGIHKALLVYRHWNNNYDQFIRDCITHHTILPPRIQSWYVILAAHWHLGAILLADVIESIDQKQVSSAAERETRETIGFVARLRRDSAFAVASLAQCSLNEQGKSVQPRQFHDSLAEAAFLTEPFTVLLIQAFARAGCIFLDLISSCFSPTHNIQERSLEGVKDACIICIRALRCLGRKSDMASLVSRSLTTSLNSKIGGGILGDEIASRNIFGS